MTRRLAVLVAGFAALVGLFAVYWVYIRGREGELAQVGVAPRPGEADERFQFGRVEVKPSEVVDFERYDADNRLREHWHADRWKKDGARMRATAPRARWFLRTGEILQVTAREGLVLAEDAGDRIDPRNGELAGDVCIVYDRGTDPRRPPMEQRPQDTLRIHVDRVKFDNDTLTITSDSYVSLFSKEVDILGRGLRIAWSEGPRQLRELRIHHGEYMCIREGQQRFITEVLLPGGAQPEEAPATAPAGAVGTGTAVRAALPILPLALMPAAALPAATAPASAPAGATAPASASRPAATAPAAATTSPAATAPAVAAATRPARTERYVARLLGDVRVTSGPRSIRGVDELQMVFEFERPEELRRSPTRPPGGGVATQPATRPGGQGEAKRPEPSQEPLVITWSGPLVVEPFVEDATTRPVPLPEPKQRRFDVYARGKRVELSDGEAQAVCRRLEVHMPAQRGTLIGSGTAPVKLTLASGERATVPKVQFDARRRVVQFEGAGSLWLPSGTETAATRPAVPAETPAVEEITLNWSRRVDLAFGRQAIDTPAGAKQREYIRSARFAGRVLARQADVQHIEAEELEVKFRDPGGPADKLNQVGSAHASGNVLLKELTSGDFIRAQRLDVEMTQGPEGQALPERAMAAGKVSAGIGELPGDEQHRQTEIEADTLTVTFQQQRRADEPRMRPAPKMLTASGNVRVTDRREAEGPVVAQAEQLVSDLPARTATLRGSFARVSQKGNSVEGAVIELDQVGERFAVRGPGRLRFLSHADISGRRSEQPQPVELAWKDGVEVLGKARTAELTGDVQLVTGGDTLQCQYMRVIFSPDEKAPEAPATRAATRPADGVQQEVQRYRARRIATVMAQKDVVLESVRKDAEGFLLRRVRLDRAKELHYEARLQRVNCFGPGRMVVEDYRPPIEPSPGAGDVLEVGDIAHPSQSVFEWTKAMEMDQKQLAVQADGGVRMVHRSGAQIALLKELPVRPYEKLPKGRRTMLVADHVLARFDEVDEKPVKGQELRGPKLGELILFEARGKDSDVSMIDGPRQVLCRMLEYRSRDEKGSRIDTATVHGSLPGEPPRDAVLYYQDPETRKLQSSKSPKLIWDRRTNRVWAPGGVEVRGSR